MPENTTIRYSLFRDTYATTVATKTAAWGDFLRMLETVEEYPSKHACPLLKLAYFGDLKTNKGSLRHHENMGEVFGVEGDHDAETMTAQRAAELCAQWGIKAVIYTSASHGVVGRKSRGGPRWRVLAPLSKPVPKGDRERLVAMLNFALEGVLGGESFTPSQSFYYGRVKGVHYECIPVDGHYLDQLDFLLDVRHKDAKNAFHTVTSADDDIGGLPEGFEVGPDTLAHLRSALMEGLSADWADDRDHWVNVAHALKSLAPHRFEVKARDLFHEFSQRCPEQYDAADCDRVFDSAASKRITIRSIFRWAADCGWINPLTRTAETRTDRSDAGNVAILAQHVHGNLRHVQETKTWLWWDGERWNTDGAGTQAQRAALQVAEHYRREAAKLQEQLVNPALDEEGRKAVSKAIKGIESWAIQCRNKGRIDAMLVLAQRDSRFALSITDLDKNPLLFGVDNGVVDLKTGQLRAAGRDDFVTKRSPIAFVTGAPCPRFAQFMDEITALPDPSAPSRGLPRSALAHYLHSALGYALTGTVPEQKMFFAIGPGSNGKNVLLDLVQHIMGDYCVTLAPEVIMANRHDADAERPTPSARRLAGARLAIASESKEGARLNVALVKAHTGNATMTARALHENTFSFAVTHKLWLMTNHAPALDHIDDALRGRLHLIPFDRTWNRPGHTERDPNLPDGDKNLSVALLGEAEGVLQWLIAGAVAYLREGLEPPFEVTRMTRRYLEDADPFGRWFAGCDLCAPESGTKSSVLHQEFITWCLSEGLSQSAAGSLKSFAAKLVGRGVAGKDVNVGKMYGLRARADLF